VAPRRRLTTATKTTSVPSQCLEKYGRILDPKYPVTYRPNVVKSCTGTPHLELLIGTRKQNTNVSETALIELHRKVSVQKLKSAT
jgi:hypothetical protein